jgi:hypothetical protein
MIGTKFANRELEEKNNIRLAFKTTPKALQTTNQKVTLGNIQEMMSEYMTGGKTTLLGVIGLVVFYKVPIYLFDDVKKIYLAYIPQNVDKDPCILRKVGRTYELYDGVDTLDKLCENSFSLESYQRPLRAISTYKRAELDNIARSNGIDVCDKSKDEVYRTLSERLVWVL